MKVLVTAGPTREWIDDVRFITNASSGRMGYACAAAAAEAGHDVTLIAGPVAIDPPAGVEVVRIETVADLKSALAGRFAACDALIMAAAVGDFTVEQRREGKIPRSGGAVTIRLTPTDDLLAGVAATKRPGQTIVAFAVEAGSPAQAEAKARAEMSAKGADFVVVNRPAALAAADSAAAVCSPDGVVVPWARRPKEDLAARIVALLGGAV